MKNIYKYLENENISKHVVAGQIVYICPVNNSLRYKKGNKFDNMKEGIVEKVGRKYFYLKSEYDPKTKYGYNCYAITDISDYSAECEIYLNKEDFELAKDYESLKHISNDIGRILDNMEIEDRKILFELLNKYK